MLKPNDTRWEGAKETARWMSRFLFGIRLAGTDLPPGFQVAFRALEDEIRQWRRTEPGELTVICRAHRRRCELKPTGGIGRAQVVHSTDRELCFSQRFGVRWEYDWDRVTVLDELMGVREPAVQ